MRSVYCDGDAGSGPRPKQEFCTTIRGISSLRRRVSDEDAVDTRGSVAEVEGTGSRRRQW